MGDLVLIRNRLDHPKGTVALVDFPTGKVNWTYDYTDEGGSTTYMDQASGLIDLGANGGSYPDLFFETIALEAVSGQEVSRQPGIAQMVNDRVCIKDADTDIVDCGNWTAEGDVITPRGRGASTTRSVALFRREDDSTLAVDPSTGERLWNSPLQVAAAPGDIVFLGDETSVQAVNANTGTPVGDPYEFEGELSGSSSWNERYWFATTDTGLTILSGADGSVVATIPYAGLQPSPPGKSVFIQVTSGGTAYWVDGGQVRRILGA